MVQVVNRDLSVAVLLWYAGKRREEQLTRVRQKQAFKPNHVFGPHQRKRPEDLDGLYVLEGLSASGLRAIRYALEVHRPRAGDRGFG